jgi:hypothetical protein
MVESQSEARGIWAARFAVRRERIAAVLDGLFARSAAARWGVDLGGDAPYGTSKLVAEKMRLVFKKLYAVHNPCLRYFSVLGPRRDPNSQDSGVVPQFMGLVLAGGDLVAFGDGLQSRGFTDEAAGSICDMGCGAPKMALDLISAISGVTHRGISPQVAYNRCSEWLLGYAPRSHFDTGIVLTFRSGPDEYGGELVQAPPKATTQRRCRKA